MSKYCYLTFPFEVTSLVAQLVNNLPAMQETLVGFLTQRSNPRLLCLLHWQVDSLPAELPREAPSYAAAAAAAKSLQSCPTLCDPIDGSPLGLPVPRILQARTLEWVAMSFSNACE